MPSMDKPIKMPESVRAELDRLGGKLATSPSAIARLILLEYVDDKLDVPAPPKPESTVTFNLYLGDDVELWKKAQAKARANGVIIRDVIAAGVRAHS